QVNKTIKAKRIIEDQEGGNTGEEFSTVLNGLDVEIDSIKPQKVTLGQLINTRKKEEVLQEYNNRPIIQPLSKERFWHEFKKEAGSRGRNSTQESEIGEDSE
ncbi:MAG: hypothetical protein AABY22_21535, partial [Nanoarchaeota archaeon]